MYFSGFSLQNEEELFKKYITKGSIVGFSYGAKKALEYSLNSKTRVDKLILISPAFFNNQKPSFKKAQLIYFKKDKENYIKNFLKNTTYPQNKDLTKYLKEPKEEELKELLNYKWQKEDLEKLINKKTQIEVFIGEKDKIIDPKKTLDFFSKITTTYYIKEAGHLLK